LADLVAFGLRISAWTLERKNNTIWLDEPFKYLSEELKPLAGEILKELSTRLGVQFIIVTHDSSIIEVADTVINVSKKGGKPSKIKESIKN
jgi:DNA repair exonuclease SbcCD ATPase subunit